MKYTVHWYHPTVNLFVATVEAESEDEAIDKARDDDGDIDWEKVADDESGLCNYCSSNDQFDAEEVEE